MMTFSLKFQNLIKLVLDDLVRGLPVLNFDIESLCEACEQEK